ncbi:MAG: hypothetical protein AAFY36_15305 [Bacteroidota bacterium]
MRFICLSVLFFWTAAGGCFAQLALQLERYGQAETLKFFRGDEISYQLVGDELWRTDPIQEIRYDINSVVLADRFITLEQIERIDLGKDSFLQGAGLALQTFGAGWAFFGLVGYAVDGNPDTRFGRGDIIVSVGSMATGLLLSKVLSKQVYKLGNRRRLRIVDLNF